MHLPVDDHLSDITEILRQDGMIVIEAPPGTGKTTRVPIALARAFEGQVLVLEPRRIAARASAGFVARELGENVGQTVGYAMRLERRSGPDTRVLYVTEALLTRRLATDPQLQGVGVVVLDEFHERSIHVDVALAWVRALRQERPDLKLVVMSATLDAEKIASYLSCRRLRVEVRRYPVDISYVPKVDDRYLEVRAAAAVRHQLRDAQGDILVFMPGVQEIRRCKEELRDIDADVLELHGELSPEEQDRALRRIPGRKRVVLSTNVAETSVTLEGVTEVIDSGLARVAGYDPWSGMATLELTPISRASATQRAGRAGRTQAGRCLRLYTKGDHDARPADTEPEIRRMDLAGTLLELGGRDLNWLDPPPVVAWSAARELLVRLGALNAQGRTPLGERMVRLPLPPRVARFVLAAADKGQVEAATSLAVMLGERRRSEVVDLLSRAQESDLTGRARQEQRQLLDLLRSVPQKPDADALCRALFEGFSDRVGRRKGHTVLLSSGGAAALAPGTPGEDGMVLVTELERVTGTMRVRSLSPIPTDWLLDQAEIRTTLRWAENRVECKEQWLYGAIVIEESPGQAPPEDIARVLLEHVRPVAHRVFSDFEAAQTLLCRIEWLRKIGYALPPLAMPELLQAACAGCRSFGDLEAVSLCALIREQITGVDVERLAPERLLLGNRQAPITYPEDGDPYISSRMQDFFGMSDGPRIANGRPLILHLLAPSSRPVQLTSDLKGFWARHYPAIRKELMRQYPRHAWPEDPLDPASIAAARPVPRRN